MNLVFRKMDENDLDQVCIIEKASFNDPWSRASFVNEIIGNSLARYYVIQAEDQVVAYIGMWIIIDEAHITNIAVLPEFRKMGIGQFLLDQVEKTIKIIGVERMTLEVRVSNESAIQLYTKMGFENIGIRPKYYQDTGEDAIIMWKTIKEEVSL